MHGPRKSPPVSARAAHLFSVLSAFLEIPFFFSLPFLFTWVHPRKRPSLNLKIFRAVFRFRAQWCANSIRFRKPLPCRRWWTHYLLLRHTIFQCSTKLTTS